MYTLFRRLPVTLWLAVAAQIPSALPALALPIPQISATIEGPSVTQSEHWGPGIFLGWEGRGPLRLVARVSGAVTEPATLRVHSLFNSCRIWVLDDESRPSEQSLHLEKYPGLDEPGVVLLIGRWNTDRSSGYSVYSDLNQAPSSTRPEPQFELGPIWLETIHTDRENQQFFKPYTFE